MREIFDTLSDNLRYIAALLAGTAIGGKLLFAESAIMTVFAIGFLVIGGLLFLYDAWRRSRQKKAEKSLNDQLSGNSAATPGGISEAARRAQLDDLRQNFLKGLTKFRAAGKDLYTLPWYMVVGEPGSGKTEAIRRCNVGFPPGLQDEMQGAGGTINMHWWFTNHAVLLDTAGKLLFQEAPPGTTTEWTEFLSLLRKNRPNCPVNGLLLVIPADTLLRDTTEELAKKAGKIAEQLDRIQRTLDVRFPVFILITKCDLLNGFREFFTDLKDPQLQHQMTGWSNPGQLDTPFKPEHVEQYLQTICQKISRRRLGLLADPAPSETNGRRADDIDSLFSLPHSIEALAPRLRRYLETVFVTGEWSAKPLFLRGIYFTSALTEGKALDMEIAQAMGVTPDSLPDGKLFERERSFFLRDLFLQKIFKEKGLVTRASNTRKQIRKRQLILGGTAATSLLAILALSIWGSYSVRNSVGSESAYWQAAAANWNPDHTWHPIVTPEFRGSPKYTYNGDNPIPVGREQIPLAEYHSRLQGLVTRDIPVPLVFKPMNALVTQANSGRRDAQRILFDSSVTRPAIDAARIRIQDTRSPWTSRETAALATLIQLEGIIHYPSPLPGSKVEFAPGTFLDPLLGLWTPDAKAPFTLNGAFDWTQYQDGAGRGKWPEKNLSAGSSLRENRPIATAWELFVKAQQTDTQTLQKDATQLASTRDALSTWSTAERDFFHYTQRETRTPGWQTETDRTYAKLSSAKTNLDNTIEQTRSAGLLPKTNPISLATSYQNLVAQAQTHASAGLKTIRETTQKFKPNLATQATSGLISDLAGNINTDALGKAAEDPAAQAAAKALAERRASFTPEFPMLQEISLRLDTVEKESLAHTQAAFGATKPEDLANLDRDHLALFQKTPLYQTRWLGYADAMALYKLPDDQAQTLVGNLAKTLETAAATGAAITARADQYDQTLMHEYRSTIRNLTSAGVLARTDALFKLHSDTVATQLTKNTGFPIIIDATDKPMTADALKQLATFVKNAKIDTGLNPTTIPYEQRLSIELTADRINRVAVILDALLARDGSPAPVKIQIPNYNDQKKIITERGISTDFGASFAGNLWRTVRLDNRASRTQTPTDNDLATAKVSDTLPPLELFLAADTKTIPDATLTFEHPWTTLRLITQNGVRKPDGRTWQTPVAIKDNTAKDPATASNLYLILQFQYENPLPELADWPSLKTLKLN